MYLENGFAMEYNVMVVLFMTTGMLAIKHQSSKWDVLTLKEIHHALSNQTWTKG